ncbi:monocyte chemotactic protein 1B-like isoform X1 [Labeo rohita]|uniref:monocyte chemotactic protein 1B-like isoform X1 n=1 Tax=Labeo rohita TaxID=84645 RepID=UPI0021E22167|nr:monocyte chemotactic protein 1B-like isoform X1 [Labeo rohita]
MRSLMSVLFLVIFCSVQMTSATEVASEAANTPSECCVEFSNVKIPVKLVASYSWTSSNCPKRAIVFKTSKGKKFCVDPETTWVSHHVNKVDKRTTVEKSHTVSV